MGPYIRSLLSKLVFGFSLGCAFLPETSSAESAAIVMSDVCEDPAAVFDHRWASDTAGATTVFYMADNGTVYRISEGNGALGNFEDLYVFAHGAPGTINNMGYEAFAQHLENAHPAIPNSVSFGVCYSAIGPNSLLKRVNVQYGGLVNRLSGGVVACALTGNGDRRLANAEYRIRVGHSDDERYKRIVDNIHAKWAENYPGTETSYADYCRASLNPFDAGRLRDFMETVFDEFSVANPEPNSTDYLELVALNIDGEPLTVCGQDPAGRGRVDCP